MRNQQRNIPTFLLIACLVGCVGIQSGNDPIVVNAQRTIPSAHDTINAFLKVEADNHATIKAQAPQVSNYANYLRAHYPAWNQSAWSLLDTYRHNRTPQNKANLQTILATLTNAIAQAQNYMSQISP